MRRRIQHQPKELRALLGLLLAAALPTALTATSPVTANRKPAAEQFQHLPLYFVENRGQVDRRVAYYLQGRDTSLFFTSRGITFALSQRSDTSDSSAGSPPRSLAPSPHRSLAPSPPRPLAPSPLRSLAPSLPHSHGARRWALKLDFLGADPHANPLGEDRTPAVISYFRGRPEQWKTGLKTFSRLAYRNLWPGIDLVYSGTENRLKYEFVVRPGADPRRIRLAYRGASEVRLNPAGELDVSTPAGGFHDAKPYVYQETAGKRVEVPASYLLGRVSEASAAPSWERGRPARLPGSTGSPRPSRTSATEPFNVREYGFRIGAYDRSRPLVLDPEVFLYAGFLGGGSDDKATAIAVDGSGNAYVTGFTTSDETAFPVSVGPDTTFNGATDAFVARVNASGTGLDYCGFIGGSGVDFATGVAVDGFGNAYVIGYTSSHDTSFPVSVGPDTTFNGASLDAFVARVNASGTGLDYCGYIGGALDDRAYGIAVDGSGNAYVTGQTASDQTTFPVGVGPDTIFNGGSDDAFVARVNASGTGLDYCGYIGGSGSDIAYGITVDGSGNAYVTGQTASDQTTFPVSVGPDTIFNGGSDDAFVARVNASGTGLDYCGYLGGSGSDTAYGIAVDGSGNAFVTGQTASDQTTFPVSVGPDTTFNGGSFNAFVARVNASGTGLDYCGYIGGSSIAYGVVVDGSGNAYVTGSTSSDENTFPVSVGPDTTQNGGNDAFVARVNASGSGLDYCGFIGGSDYETSTGVAVDGSGNAYVTGYAASDQTTFPDGDGFGGLVGPDLTFNGGAFDAFVVKIGEPPPPPPTVTVTATDPLAAEAGPDPGLFTVARSSSTGSLTVNIALQGTADNGGDYQALPLTVSFLAGQATKTVTVTPLQDAEVEADETVVLVLRPDASYTIGVPDQATVTIADQASLGRNLLPSFPISPQLSNALTAGPALSLGDYTGLAFLNGELYPAWADNSSGLSGNPDSPHLEIATSRITLNGNGTLAISTPQDVSLLPGNQSSAEIAVNPVNPQNLVIVAALEGAPGLLVARSLNGGSSWTSQVIANGGGGLAPASGSPAVAFDQFGTCIVVYLDQSRTSVPVLVSANGGSTFVEAARLAGGEIGPPAVATGPGPTPAAGSVWVTFNDFRLNDSAGGVVVARAAVTGLAALQPFQTEVVAGSTGGTFADIDVGPAGKAALAYQVSAQDEGPASIKVHLDADGLGNNGFGAPVLTVPTGVGSGESIPAHGRISAQARLAYDRSSGPNAGRLYLVYTDEVGSETSDTDILLRFSGNGTAWSAPVRISDDRGTSSQFLPRIDVDPVTGDVAVVWYDCRNDPGAGSGLDSDGQANTEAQLRGTILSAGPPPVPVFNLNLAITPGVRVDLTWQESVPNEVGFEILRNRPQEPANVFTRVAVVPPGTTAFTDFEEQQSSAAAGRQCLYRVRSFNLGGSSPFVAKGVNTAPGLPAPPGNLTVTDGSEGSVSETAVRLNWQDRSKLETAYAIKRRTGNDPFQEIARLAADSTSYTDEAAPSNQRVDYEVDSVGDLGQAFARAYAILAVRPQGLQVTHVGGHTMDLSWQDGTTVEEGYRIERKSGSGSFRLVGTVNADGVAFTDDGLDSKTPYTYRVRAYNDFGKSKPSNQVGATTLSTPQVTAVNPATGAAGETLDVTLTGSGIENVPGPPAVSFGAGVTVNSVTFNASTSVTAHLSIAVGVALGLRDATLTNPDGGASTLPAAFRVVAPGPQITGVDPSSGAPGQTLDVDITGSSFQDGAAVEFGTGITTQGVTFGSASLLTAHIAIAANAALGARSVTVTNPDTKATTAQNAFQVAVPGPQITAVNPGSGAAGLTLDVALSGTGFQDPPSVSFGPGILVNSVTFSSSGSVTAHLTLTAGAALGFRDVTLTNPDQQASTLQNGFRVVAPGPQITGVDPSSGGPGQTRDVDLSGTGFQNGATVGFGAEITVQGVAFQSSTRLTAHLLIASNAALGPRNVTVTNPDGKSSTAPNAFQVVPPPQISEITPCFGKQGQTLSVALTGGNFGQTPAVDLGPGITVQNVLFNSSTRLTASILISPGAATGLRTLAVTNPDGQTASAPGAFAVAAAAGAGKLKATAPKFRTTPVGVPAFSSVKVQNRGRGPLTFCPGGLTGPFRLTGNPGPQIIPPGGQALVPVSFTPPARGTQRGTLVLFSDDPQKPQASVKLQGKGK